MGTAPVCAGALPWPAGVRAVQKMTCRRWQHTVIVLTTNESYCMLMQLLSSSRLHIF
jgi:hypothetical protein